jgi:predicted 2-oxoglutarate/Fe(II)-dependent dioxygenase YbiX
MYHKLIKNILTDNDCDEIIDYSLKNYILKDVITTNLKTDYIDYSFNKRKGVKFKDNKFVDLENKILTIVNTEKIFSGVIYDQIPDFLFNQYKETDFLNYHNDRDEIIKNAATLTVIVQLNDNYEGGEFFYKIDDIEYEVPKIKGSVFIFDSYMLHKVSPVKSGIRYSFNTWPTYSKIKNKLI